MLDAGPLADLFLELQAFDRVPRTGYVLRGVAEPESVAEHSWQVAILVWALGGEVDGLDRVRALEMALLHDLAELRTGDIPRTAHGYFPDGARKEAEGQLLEELLAPLGERERGIAQEYAAGTSREARFVRVCDRLQLLFKATVYQQWGAGGLDEFFHRPDAFDADGFEAAEELYRALRAHRGKSDRPLEPQPANSRDE